MVTTNFPSGASMTAESSPGPTIALSEEFNRAIVRRRLSLSPSVPMVSALDT